MKRISICMLLTLPLVVLAMFLPVLTGFFLPQVELQKLQTQSYTDTIYTTGKIEEASKTELTYEIPIVPEKVLVSVGDEVKIGETIAKVDVEKTEQAALSLLSLSDKLPKEAVAALSSLNLELDQLNAVIPNEIKADSDGVVSDLGLSEGAVTYPSEVCAVISRLGELRAKLNVPEEYAGCLSLSQTVRFTVEALADQEYSGSISKIFPTAHETLVGTAQETIVSCYSSIQDANSSLKAGYTVAGKIAVGEELTLSCLPYEAIGQDEQGQEYVYLLKEGRAVRQNITTGIELETHAQVTEGVSSDDLVLASCAQVKRDGQFVTVSRKD